MNEHDAESHVCQEGINGVPRGGKLSLSISLSLLGICGWENGTR